MVPEPELTANQELDKQRFSRWYNRRQERFGTLWAGRFKSVLVEDKSGTVEAVTAARAWGTA